MNGMNDKAFDRSVCFTFFESYLNQSELIRKQYGEDVAYRCLSGIVKYALYQEEPEDMFARIVVEGLKNTIDANQAKRSKSFGEDIAMTNMIIEYKTQNPKASYQKIADELGCSKSKVGKVLTPLKGKFAAISSSNSNSNSNDNSSSNSNSVDVDVDDTRHLGKQKTETCKSSTGSDNRGRNAEESSTAVDASEKKRRFLEDLDDEELDILADRFSNHTRYQSMYEEFNLVGGCLDRNLAENIERIKSDRYLAEEESKPADVLGVSVSDCEKLARNFGTLNTIDGVVACVDILKSYMGNPDGCDAKDLVALMDKNDYGLDGTDGDWERAAKDWEGCRS